MLEEWFNELRGQLAIDLVYPTLVRTENGTIVPQTRDEYVRGKIQALDEIIQLKDRLRALDIAPKSEQKEG